MTTRKPAGAKKAPASTKKTPAKTPAGKTRKTAPSAPKKEEEKVQAQNTPATKTPAPAAEKKEEVQPQNTPSTKQETPAVENEVKDVTIAPTVPFGPVVVIPYRDSKAAGKELLFALRAWEKHLDGITAIVIVGDLPAAINPDTVIHIPHKPESNNPQEDVAQKLAAVVASELVPDVFILSNDDIFPLAPISLIDIAALKATGPLKQKGAPGRIYNQNSIRTIEALKKMGIKDPKDYATHTPVVFEKEKLAQTLAEFKATKNGYLVSSLYFNQHYPNARPLITLNGVNGASGFVASIWSANPDRNVMRKVLQERAFVNCNDAGYKVLEAELVKLFPKKSRFEK